MGLYKILLMKKINYAYYIEFKRHFNYRVSNRIIIIDALIKQFIIRIAIYLL
ncbi:hypothetical protein BN3087_610003 [Sulfurovum sp. enrichment culture clone C5]|uniref:Uncharacterized protein n=1 Tax=Sulfurovum sp. enrichment culture clone C5 TaxID=497650 RepID=A0A0S4XPD5_9BACT|nr:hypothetical protein BN3087_610003 [Sulfurovum sp. enrichment culture clone C5]